MNKLLIALGLASTVAFVGCAKKEEAPAAPAEETSAPVEAPVEAPVDAAVDAAASEEAPVDAAASEEAPVDAAAPAEEASAPAAQ